MRQLLVQVPKGHGGSVMEIAEGLEAVNTARFEAQSSKEALELVFVHVSNGKVGPLIDRLQEIPELHVTLVPQGVISLKPPAEHAPEQVTDVEERSPLEVFLGGLQQVGSWKGFLGYAAAAGVVVWIGLFTNTIYLLTAAMLIAPFAGPAMNVAIGTARGDQVLLRQGVVRYFAALAVTVAVTFLLSLLMGQEIATQQMIERSQLSVVAVLLPLVAGAAGALNLVQSDRSSLVSGAATGMLVAASLAPPAGMVGMASAIGEWDMVVSGLFVLILQLVGINLGGSLIFRAFGLSARGVRFERGKRWLFPIVLAVTGAMLAGLLYLQFSSPPEFQRSSRSQRAAATIQTLINESRLVEPVETNVRFTRADIASQNTLLAVLFVQKRDGVEQPDEEIRRDLTLQVQARLLEEGFNVTPLVSVTVLEPPP